MSFIRRETIMINLKPCPFCGSNSVRICKFDTEEPDHVVECKNCGIAMIYSINDGEIPPIEETIKAWNRRANDESR